VKKVKLNAQGFCLSQLNLARRRDYVKQGAGQRSRLPVTPSPFDTTDGAIKYLPNHLDFIPIDRLS